MKHTSSMMTKLRGKSTKQPSNVTASELAKILSDFPKALKDLSVDLPPPRPYQFEAAKFMVSRPAAGIFLDPGLGKSRITLMALEALRSRKIIRRTLIVAPMKVALGTWPNEIVKWRVPARYAVLHDDWQERERGPKIKKDNGYAMMADYDIINYDGLSWLFRKIKALRDYKRYDAIVLDESSRVKHANTERFRTLRKMIEHIGKRYILTGTPVPNGLLDLFGQIYMLDLGEALGAYVTRYRQTYFYPSGYGGYTWTLQSGAAEKITAKIAPLVHRIDSKGLVKRPEPIFLKRFIDLPPTARKAYDQIKKDMIAEFKGRTITAANAAVVSGKLRQIANGGLYVDRSNKAGTEIIRETLKIHDAKTEDLRSLVDELQGKQVLVGYEFKHDCERIRKEFKDATFVDDIGGKQNQINKIQNDWNAHRIQMLVAQTSSIQHGLNLQEGDAHVVVHYGLPWDLEAYQQFYQRIARPGNNSKTVLVYHILARATVDQTGIMVALGQKDRTQLSFLDALLEDLGL